MTAAFDHRLPEELAEFQKVVRRFAVEEIAPVIGDYYERGAFPYELVAKMGAMGLFGLALPRGVRRDGGRPARSAHRARGARARRLVGRGHPRGRHQPRRRRSSSASAPRSSVIATFRRWRRARSWPLSRSPSPGAVRTRLPSEPRRGASGNEYVLNGTKAFITNSGTDITSLLIVAAVTGTQAGGRSEISSFIVPAGSPGVTVGKKYSKVGWLASDTHEVAFSDCQVPAENLLGPEGRGYAQFLEVLDEGRIGVAAIAVGLGPGMCRRVDPLRLASGRPSVTESGSTRRSGSRSPTWRQGPTPLGSPTCTRPRGTPVVEPFKKEAAIAKLVASDAAVLNAREATQIFGGYGFVNDTPVARFWRDAKILEIGEGTSEVLRILIARELGVADHRAGT